MVAIGIDRYSQPAWCDLRNAVSDARGAVRAFEALGFESKVTSLVDHAATRDAFDRLLDDLGTLGPNDDLVVFFAGHGHTDEVSYEDRTRERVGYLIPADGRTSQPASWVRLDSWLSKIARLPPRHILVILDCCHSGVALTPPIKLHGTEVSEARWRGAQLADPLGALRTRRSRRVITSALDDQRASDDGPIAGHSLFTGCLIRALAGEVFEKPSRARVTASDIWKHIQHEVSERSGARQTPDFGAFERDERGELVVEAAMTGATPALSTQPTTASPSSDAPPVRRKMGLKDFVSPVSVVQVVTQPSRDSSRTTSRPPPNGHSSAPSNGHGRTPSNGRSSMPPGLVDKTSPNTVRPGPLRVPAPRAPRRALDAAFVSRLDRHYAARRRGDDGVLIVAAEGTTAVTGWATWAAQHGMLTLATELTGVDTVVSELLTAMPWLRLLPEAHARFARATGIELSTVQATLRDRSDDERETWIEELGGVDRHACVGGWLLSMVMRSQGSVFDRATIPVQGRELLSTLCELAAPVAVVLHHRDPDEAWLGRALRTADELAGYMPGHPVAVAAPSELIQRVLRRSGSGFAKQLDNVVPLARVPASEGARRGQLARLVLEALQGDPRTAASFALTSRVSVHDRERPVLVEVMEAGALLAIVIDDWYRSHDPQRYRADREQDLLLQRAGIYVMRFLAEDVETRLPMIVDQVALGLEGRRASGSFPENINDISAE